MAQWTKRFRGEKAGEWSAGDPVKDLHHFVKAQIRMYGRQPRRSLRRANSEVSDPGAVAARAPRLLRPSLRVCAP